MGNLALHWPEGEKHCCIPITETYIDPLYLKVPSICLLHVNTTTASLVIWGKACSYPARLLSLSEFKYFVTRVRREQESLLALANIASLFHIPISSQLV